MDDLPKGIDLERHVLLHGRARHPGYRRALFGLVCVLPLLALADLFGQASTTSTASAAQGTLRVDAPARLRGGLLYQVRIEVTAARDIRRPQLVFGPGWWEQMTQNSTNPQPINSSASNGRVTLSYSRLNAGRKLTVWLQFQVNPVNDFGKRTTNVELTDGPTPIARVNRSLTVLP